MTAEIVAVILTGVGVTAGVLLGVWRGRRIDGVRTELGGRIDQGHANLGGRIDGLNGRIDLVYQELIKGRS